MIVDVHTHTPTHRGPVPPGEVRINTTWRPDRTVPVTVSWDDYSTALQTVDWACVFGIRLRGDEENVNDEAAAVVRAYPDKLIGFMSVHPEEEDPVAEMERCYHDLGLRGLKLGPNYQGFDPLGKRAFLVYGTAQRMGLPIMFHQGTSPERDAPLRYAHPLVMDEVAMAFPEVRMVMAHMATPGMLTH